MVALNGLVAAAVVAHAMRAVALHGSGMFHAGTLAWAVKRIAAHRGDERITIFPPACNRVQTACCRIDNDIFAKTPGASWRRLYLA